ncbi:putative galactose oxidase [Aspergillus clavatus NRRL 1]|uniref:F5/8 type C domain protein n=1 Tax=Aspergillus clavatus (strain ATCC 1007 / CBS 513.65 / DSM 816 / NCTC 3887 / NRRL 1 / QM 1276 / 107) TaxID=344612 RepID=A1C8B2_ASPCL|nr:F5/8 type C domain protein [Aspergillus clavatus NRRL 1]EAW14633.1 F5/8 type C domain protein [Aspergillus clavatus NRRL 1]
MKLKWASTFLLGTVAVDAFKPAEFSYESSEAERIDIAKSVTGRIKYQSPPADSDLIPKTNAKDPSQNWKVQCSSQYEGYDCGYAIDDRSDRYWHSDPTKQEEASWIVVDLRKEYYVSGLTMLPRLDKDVDHGQIGKHRISLSQDGEIWTDVAYGTWGSNKSPKMSAFIPKPARFVKLVAETTSRPDRSQIKNGKIAIVNLAVYSYNEGTFPAEDPSKGVWGPTINLPIVPVSSAVEQHGDIIMWSAWADDQFFASPGGKTLTTTMNREGIITQSEVFETKHDMFCPGTSMDVDGNIVVSGGADSGRTSVYNGTAWVKGPSMAIPRGYHASTTLSDGRIFTIGGSWSGGDKVEKNGEVYVPGETPRWERRPGAKVEPMMTDDRLGAWRADNHPWLFGWKDASVFQAGPSKMMHWYNVDAKDHKGRIKGSVREAGKRKEDHDSMSGSAVMYDATKGKILTFGGQRHYDGSYGSKNAHIITLGLPYQEPRVEVAGKGPDGAREGGMNYERVFHTSVVLPDGKVFIVGGQNWGKPFHEGDIDFTPEIYDPETDTFVKQSRNNIKRVYHSISMLLPDATVLNGGGGLCGNCSANHYDAEIFTPPYLFNADGKKAARPEILKIINGNLRVAVGKVLRFETDSAIKSASLVRVGTTTHTVNTDQRRVPLVLNSLPQNRYTARLPDDAGIILPGWYMLFAMNAQGTPSEAKMVKVELPSGHRYESSKYTEAEGEKDLTSGNIGGSHYCDDDDDAVEGSMSFIFALTSNFWKTWKSVLITKA